MTIQEYQEVLKNAAKTMVRVKNPRRLLKMIARFIVKEVQLTHASILVQDPSRHRYVFVDSKGHQKIPINLVRLDHDNPLIQWFSTKDQKFKLRRDYLLYHDIVQWLNDHGLLNGRSELGERLTQLKRAMEVLKAVLCVPGTYKGELVGIMILGEKLNGEAFQPEEISFFQTLAIDGSLAVKTAGYREELLERNLELELKQKELKEKLREIEVLRSREQETYYQIVLSLAQEVYEKDPYTFGHLATVERLGLMTAKELGYDFNDGRKKDILMAALHLHDVGKIGIPDSILKKAGPLTDEEWKIMQKHPAKGAKILEPLSGFKEVASIVLRHHENYDGTGYPAGIKGEDIPIEARIVAVVDAFHAIVSTRCYRKGRSWEIAVQELEKYAGTQFDPNVVHAFVRAYRKETSNRAQPAAT